MSIARDKKMLRLAQGLCMNCGHDYCACKIPKRKMKTLPIGTKRKGTKGVGH